VGEWDRTIPLIVTFVLSIVASVAGVKYQTRQRRGELLDVIAAVQNDNLSEEEGQKIAADAKALAEG
jgi:hypothetical protein